MGLAGTVLIVARSGVSFEGRHAFGYAAAFLCALTWSSYSLVSRRFGAVPTDVVTAFCLATAVLALLCHMMLETTVWPQSGSQWLAVLGLGLMPVGAAFYAWDHGVKRGDIQVLGAASYAAPLISTIVLIAAGFGELSWRIALACLLITGGAALAARNMILQAAAGSGRTGVESGRAGTVSTLLAGGIEAPGVATLVFSAAAALLALASAGQPASVRKTGIAAMAMALLAILVVLRNGHALLTGVLLLAASAKCCSCRNASRPICPASASSWRCGSSTALSSSSAAGRSSSEASRGAQRSSLRSRLGGGLAFPPDLALCRTAALAGPDLRPLRRGDVRGGGCGPAAVRCCSAPSCSAHRMSGWPSTGS